MRTKRRHGTPSPAFGSKRGFRRGLGKGLDRCMDLLMVLPNWAKSSPPLEEIEKLYEGGSETSCRRIFRFPPPEDP